jgi:protein-tyrosine phosphatase
VRILFVCMGNICRSPLAENVFRHLANARGVMDQFDIDSAGTGGWHAGEPPDHRMQATARARGVMMIGRARQVRTEDFERYDLLLCADEDNRRNLLKIGAPKIKTRLLLEFHPDVSVREVPDPYYGEGDGFERVFDLCEAACRGLLEHLKGSHLR